MNDAEPMHLTNVQSMLASHISELPNLPSTHPKNKTIQTCPANNSMLIGKLFYDGHEANFNKNICKSWKKLCMLSAPCYSKPRMFAIDMKNFEEQYFVRTLNFKIF